ncbi:MAG TPA: response regulator [Thermoplasmata archaeon]|nr:response regulator [Thermoplasmata archaeon]
MRETRATGPGQPSSSEGGRALRILIVDDDATFRTELGGLLQASGYEVSLAADRSEALERLRTDHVDVVLLDLVLPGTSGLDILREALAAHPTTPFILLTGFGTPEVLVEARKAGASDVLPKPFEFEALERLLRAHGENRRAGRGAAAGPEAAPPRSPED